jgi:hypothetical protein
MTEFSGRQYIRKGTTSCYEVVREHLTEGRITGVTLRHLETGRVRRIMLATLWNSYREVERRTAPRDPLTPMPEQQP